MTAKSKTDVSRLGADFVAAVLMDNERLRKELAEVVNSARSASTAAQRREWDQQFTILQLVERLGGDVKVNRQGAYIAERKRLVIETEDYDRVKRYRLLPDTEAALVGDVFDTNVVAA